MSATPAIPAATPAAPANRALAPVVPAERVFGFREHAALWFSLGTGLLVMQVGAYLVPAVGTRQAVWAIVLGAIAGAGLLGWVARMACVSGLSSVGLMHATFGSAFARLPVALNLVQLVGWATFELVVMRDGTQAIAARTLGAGAAGAAGTVLATLLWGGVLLALMTGSMLGLVRRFVSRIGLPLVVASLAWLTWQFWLRLRAGGAEAFWMRPGDGSMGLPAAFDLVVAMPVSWLPLVADYARHGRRGAHALGGTWLGYALANAWCYGLGVMVASTVVAGTDLVAALLLAQGGLVALGLILLDELDNAYGDAHSGAVAAHSMAPAWSIRRWGLALAALATVLALLLPMRSLEPFLLLLSSVFVPLFGVIVGRLGAGAKWAAAVSEPGGPAGGAGPAGAAGAAAAGGPVDWRCAAIWLGGIALYHALARLAPQAGAALPTLVATFVLARLARTGR